MNLLKSLTSKRCIHRHTIEDHPQCFPMATKSGKLLPRVLVFDIETLPMQVFVWGLYKQRISPDNVISDYCILSWSAKWLFDSNVISSALTSREAIARDDKRILKTLWDMFNEADIVIAHNGNGFDIPKLNTRFIVNGFTPPMPYKSIDTLSVARSKFAFSSNRLDYLAKFLGVGEKISTNYGLWIECFKGNKEALKDMERYNRHDVEVLEDVYVKLRPWMKSHPNMALYVETETHMCPVCNSTSLKWADTYTSNSNVYKAFRCNGCGAVGRGKESILTKEKIKSLTSL